MTNSPLKNKSKKRKNPETQKPTGEFESVNTLSSDSGRDIDEVKRAGGVVKAGGGRNQIPFCVEKSDITTSPLTSSRGFFPKYQLRLRGKGL